MNSSLQFILGSFQVVDFIARYYQKRALHIGGEKSKFENLFGWDDLNRVLNASPQPHSGMKMAHEGRQFWPNDATSLIEEVQKGSTLILEDLDRYHLGLGAFLGRLSDELCEETRFNLYLSHPETKGYHNHYDTQDFFILQLSGYKEWWIFPETIPSVLFHQKKHGIVPPPKESCYLHCTLGPGDVLYVPRGHWHYAIARDEPSLHLTLAVFVKTGIDFMKWLCDELTECERFRASLPLSFDQVSQVQTANSNEWLGQIKAGLAEVLSEPGIYERFQRHGVAMSRNRQPFQFPNHSVTTIEAGPRTLFLRRIQRSSVSVDSLSGKVELVCSGRQLYFDGEAELLLRYIFRSEEFTGEELLSVSGGLSWSAIQSVLLPLMREGFVNVCGS